MKIEKEYDNSRPLITIGNDPDNEIELRIRVATTKGYQECPKGGLFDVSYPTSKLRRARVQGGQDSACIGIGRSRSIMAI